jgi:hypothetical protein
MPRYIDEPFALQLAQLDEARAVLRRLADYRRSPLPQRLRSICARMVVRLGEVQHELGTRPDMLTIQREEENARGETGRPLLLEGRSADASTARRKSGEAQTRMS